MKRQRLLILVGLGALGMLAVAGTAAAATVKQPEPGEDGGDTEGEGEAPIDFPPPPPPDTSTQDFGPPPNSDNRALLDGFFVNGAGIARALYLLGFGTSSADMATQLDKEAQDADKDDDLPFVREFQKAYNRLAMAGRAGKGDPAFGTIPNNLGSLKEDGTMGYRTLGALYNTLRHFSPGQVWSLTTNRIKGSSPITTGERADLRGYLNNLA